METDLVNTVSLNHNILTVNVFQKTNYYINNEYDIWLNVQEGIPTVRTENHFHKYSFSQRIMIPKGTNFSIYNTNNAVLIIEIDEVAWNKNEIVEQEFLNKQYIGTGLIREGYERKNIYSVFEKYYKDMGYEIITSDSDHENFRRSVSRNILAAVFPNEILIILDGDAFYTKEQMNNAVEYAMNNDRVIVKPNSRFLQVDYFDGFDPDALREKFKDVKLDELELVYESGNSHDGHNFIYYGWYTGLAWVQKTDLWWGMDERCVGWGHEDIIFCYCCDVFDNSLVKLDNGYVLTMNHPRDISEEHNTTIGNQYYSLSDKDALKDMLYEYALHGTFGRFVKLPHFLV